MRLPIFGNLLATMVRNQFFIAFSTAIALSGCGGGGSDNSNNAAAANSIQSTTTFNFVTPSAGTEFTFSETLIDNLNNTINRTIVDNLISVNADGSFTQSTQDPTGNSNTTGTVNHTVYPTTEHINNVGQETDRTISHPNGSSIQCIESPHGSGPPSPMSPGQTWTFSYTETCGNNGPVNFTQSGTYSGVESVTVPAGTFTAYKFQSTIISTNSSGTTTTQTITNWRNAANNNSHSVKQLISIAYSGAAPPQGSIVSVTRILQSYQ